MKIAIDSAALGSKFRHMGIYVYAQNLISQFRGIDGEGQGIEFCVFNYPGFANDANLLQPGGSGSLSSSRWLRHERRWNTARVQVVQRALLWSLARFARAIITVSQCSKHDLIETYGLPEHKVSVVYQGYDKSIFDDAAANPELQGNLRQRLGIGESYIVHHGVIQPRKNLKRLIEAYRMMLERNRNLPTDLVLAGPLGWRYAEVLAAAKADAGSKG